MDTEKTYSYAQTNAICYAHRVEQARIFKSLKTGHIHVDNSEGSSKYADNSDRNTYVGYVEISEGRAHMLKPRKARLICESSEDRQHLMAVSMLDQW